VERLRISYGQLDRGRKIMMQALQWASIVSAFLAAALWFWSASVPTPADFPVDVVTPDLGGPDFGYSPKLTELGQQTRWQSKLSGWAATAAGFAAGFQALHEVIVYCQS
jgi:hypothetical protein